MSAGHRQPLAARISGQIPVIRQTIAAVAAGAVSFALAAVVAVVLTVGVFLGAVGCYFFISSFGPLAWPLALLATALVVGAFLWVLFGMAAVLSAQMRTPRWSSVGVAGVLGGAVSHWLLSALTWANWVVFDVTFPYWWRHFEEIHFG